MREFWRKLRGLYKRDELAQRLREELEFHAEMKVSQSGLTVSRARCEIGNEARIINGGAIIDHDPPRERWLVAVEK